MNFPQYDAPQVARVKSKRPSMRLLAASVFLYAASVLLASPVPGLSKLTYGCVALILLALISLSGSRPLIFKHRASVGWAFALLCWALFSTFWAPDYSIATTRLASLSVTIAAFALISVAFDNGLTFRPLLLGLITGVLGNTAVAIVQATAADDFRVAGLVGNENLFGMQLAMVGLLSLSELDRGKRWPVVLCIGLVVAATALSGSRKVVFVWVSLLLLGIQVIYSNVRRSRVALGAALILVPIVTVAIYFAVPALRSAVDDLHVYHRFMLLLDGGDTSSTQRVGMIQDGFRLWSAAPLHGHGIDQFRVLTEWGAYSHNNYVELLSTLGLVGFSLFYAQYGIVLSRAVAARTAGHLTFVLVLTLLVWDVAAVSYTVRSHWLFLNAIGFLSLEHKRLFPPERRTTERSRGLVRVNDRDPVPYGVRGRRLSIR